MEKSYGICKLSFAPLRALPAHSSQMVSQLLFGMGYEVLAIEDKWFKVKVLFDGYQGYLHRAQHFGCSEESLKVPRYVARDYQASNPPILPGSELFSPQPFRPVEQTWRDWLGVPYLWGGISIWGTDCSGFVQTLYKIAGVALLRDSKDQATQGQPVDWQDRKAGDLLFFGEQNITHTAILLEDDFLVHCYGRVRQDRLCSEGILTEDFGLTHPLKSIRRVA